MCQSYLSENLGNRAKNRYIYIKIIYDFSVQPMMRSTYKVVFEYTDNLLDDFYQLLRDNTLSEVLLLTCKGWSNRQGKSLKKN